MILALISMLLLFGPFSMLLPDGLSDFARSRHIKKSSGIFFKPIIKRACPVSKVSLEHYKEISVGGILIFPANISSPFSSSKCSILRMCY